ncbi:hypothetical protein PUN28_005674 [Cardiocondyla obscurior]|uniref:Cilia- and flagella-associated protein 43 n=1 Tax=Cardiocondyla obscurior TaxID=286306 RepID=A0AAW2G745_9HYME
MHIDIGDDKFTPRHFIVCSFYDVETCFCWDGNKLVTFPYTKDSLIRNHRVIITPAPIKKIQFFNNRAFLICTPQGAYKVSRNGELAILSKNALGMGGEFFQVLVTWNNCVYLDDKQVKSSLLLFSLVPYLNETVCTFSLNPENIELNFMRCFTAGWEVNGNLCIIAHHKKLYILRDSTTQLVYTSENPILNILSVKKVDKVTGFLLLVEDINIVILVHNRNNKLIFEKIYLGENVKDRIVLCAGFSLHTENTLWIVCCDKFKTYFIKKGLFDSAVQQMRVLEKTFICMQHYNSNIILGLSQKKELIELSVKEEEEFLSADNNIVLCTEMFENTDIIMQKICAKVKELKVLYDDLTDKQNQLKKINLYAAKQKLQINTSIEVSRLYKHRYIGLSISDQLPKDSYVVFTFTSKNQNTFCLKKITETPFTIKMPVNENQVVYSSFINMDLITLINEQRPWCLIQNFVDSPPQDLKKKRYSKKDKTAYINTKIASLQHLITEKKDLNITKLSEIKKKIRAEL